MTEDQHQAALRRIEELMEHPISRELNQLVQQTHAHEREISPTPETDAAAGNLTGINLCAAFETKCRQLEMERNEARRIAAGHRDAAKNAGIYCPYHTWLLPWEPFHDPMRSDETSMNVESSQSSKVANH